MYFLQELHLLRTNAHFFPNNEAILSLFVDLRINARFAKGRLYFTGNFYLVFY